MRQQDVCGTRSRYNAGGCRCPECREAQRSYHADRRRKVAYKQWGPYVDAEPVRLHVKELVAAGLGRRRIAELAGIDQSIIRRLEYGNPSRGKPPTRQLRPSTAERLLAVTASPESLAGAAIVDATGSHRRLQALVAVGWTQRRLADRLGVSAANMASFMRRPRILASRARAIRDLYEELWNTQPQCESVRERVAVTRAREFAAARGWAPPMDWDDIDDPKARPYRPLAGHQRSVVDPVAVERALKGEEMPLNPAEVKEVVRLGTERGMSAREIAMVAGRDTRTVQRRRANA